MDRFWGPKHTKMSQDGLPKRSKRAKIAITTDVENMHLDLFLTVLLEHQASQETPKTAKKPRWLQAASKYLKKTVHLWIDLLSKNGP